MTPFARLWTRLGVCAVAVVLAACGKTPDPIDEARLQGRQLYLANCAPCHGERADGHGPQREMLDPPPRDYTDPAWRASATPASVSEAISQGVPGTAMPAWDLLAEEEIELLTAYVLSVAEQGPWVGDEATETSQSPP